jgi:hypothetical protein
VLEECGLGGHDHIVVSDYDAGQHARGALAGRA